MRAVRAWAIAAIALLAGYHVLRLAATSCAGAACEAYVVPSLLVPAAVLVAAGLAGTLAAYAAQGAARSLLAAATLLSTAGPILALVVFRDSPDLLVPVATVLFLLSPLAALAYALRSSSPRSR